MGIISKKKGTDRTSGAPQGYAPPQNTPQLAWGPPGLGRSRLFGLLCLHNYHKIFQKRRLFKILLRGTRLGYPPWGDPPMPLGPPPRGPRGSQSSGKNSKNSKIIYKKFTCIIIPQNYNSNINFGQLGSGLQRARNAEKVKI